MRILKLIENVSFAIIAQEERKREIARRKN